MATRTAARAKIADEPTGGTIWDRFHPVTERAIRELSDSGSFDRGRGYVRNRWIHDESLRGETLRAACYGQSGGPYQVEATLVPRDVAPPDGSPIVSVGCTCPRGGFCKHIVALLLTWIATPERFVVRPPAAELLAGKSREDLIAIVELAIRRDPDLADLIELTPPAATSGATNGSTAPGTGRARTISAAAIDRQVERAFQLDGGAYSWDDYHAGRDVARQVREVRALADGYAAAGRWADAVAVDLAIVNKATREESYVRDDEGDLFVEVSRSVTGLIQALAKQTELPPDERLTKHDRAELIEALYAFWEYGENYDFMDEFDPIEALAAHATAEERAEIEGWLRTILHEHSSAGPTSSSNYVNNYRLRRVLSFLEELKGDDLSLEDLLAEYQSTELWPESAGILLELNRVDEAIGLAGRKLDAMDLMPFADSLIAHDKTLVPRAFDLIEGWLWQHEGSKGFHEQHVLSWLQDRYSVHGQPDRALEAARRRFAQQPGFATFEVVRTAAASPDRGGQDWPEIRQTLLTQLRERRDWGALFDVSVQEGDVAEALANLERHDATRRRPSGGIGAGWGDQTWEGRRRRVADAAQSSHPDEAIRLYQILAEDAIEGRQRSTYQTAAGHLTNAKAVYLANDRAQDWRSYITSLRETHKRLRALLQELDALELR